MSQLNDKLINYGNLAEFHIKLLNDLVTSDKSTWSSEKIQAMIADAGFAVEIVAELPATGDPHTIYFILKQDSSTGDVYDEWMYIDGNWEKVGNTAIDLSDYAKISDVDASLALKADKTYVDSSLAAKADVSYVDSSLALKQDVLSASTGIIIDASNNIYTNALVPTAGYNYATKYIDDDTNLEGTNVATGNYSNWAEGSKTTATSLYGGNHAEGYRTSATGLYAAHAEGYQTLASGIASHAEGYGGLESPNNASGLASHVEGEATVASGEASHAEGWGSYANNYPNSALGAASHVEGIMTIARNWGEHAEGTHNVSHKASENMGDAGNTLSSIGFHIGYSTSDGVFKNAREIMQNGDMYVFGIGDYDGIHIKGEQGAPAGLQTLQEVIANKANVYEVATLADIEALFNPPTPPQPNDEIWYTTNDGEIFTPYTQQGSGSGDGIVSGSGDGIVSGSGDGIGSGPGSGFPEILSNTYVNGKGVIKFAEDVTTIPSGAFFGVDGQHTEFEYRLTSISLPSSVTTIEGAAIGYNYNLASVSIPEGVTSIDYGFLENCPSLTTVTIPNTVTYIGAEFLYPSYGGLPHISSFSFNGTIAEWNLIEKDSYWNDGRYLTVVHCSDGDVNL